MGMIEALNKSLEEARKEMTADKKDLPKKEENIKEEEAGLKSENSKVEEKQPYTIEDLRKLKDEGGEEAIEKVEQDRLEAELLEKYKLLQGMATKRQQYIAQKEKELDKIIEDRKKIIDELSRIKNSLQEKAKEIAEYDDEFKKIYDEIEEKLKNANKYNEEEAAVNWRNAELAVRQQFPEFGIYQEKQITETLQENPRLLELAMIDNGKFGDIVLGAAHILTMLKPENFKKMILAELTNKPDDYKEIIDTIIKKQIDEYEKKQEKKKSFSDLSKKREIEKEAIPPSSKDKRKGKVNISDLLKEAASKIIKEAE